MKNKPNYLLNHCHLFVEFLVGDILRKLCILKAGFPLGVIFLKFPHIFSSKNIYFVQQICGQ